MTAELSRAQALLRDREQAAGASERLQVWVCGWVDEGKVGQCWLGGEGFADEWGGGTQRQSPPLPPPVAQAHIADELAASRAQGLRLQQAAALLEAGLEERQRELGAERQARAKLQEAVER